jgi:hypothetical protein
MRIACEMHTHRKNSKDIYIMQENSKEISTIKQRIIQYLAFKGITHYRCYKDSGMTYGILGQKGGINEENLIKFTEKYRDINTKWLLLGEGDIIQDAERKNIQEQIKEIEEKLPEITPDFLLKRYEELVIENSELKKQLSEGKKNELHGLPFDPPTAPDPATQSKLNVDKM